MSWVIGVSYKNEKVDPMGRNRKGEFKDLGIQGVERVKTTHVYFVRGNVSEEEVKKACAELLADDLIQECSYSQESDSLGLIKEKNAWVVQVKNKPGVTDAVGESTRKALLLLGVSGVEKVETAFTYAVKGSVNEKELKRACEKILANPLIQDYTYVKVSE